MVPKRPAPQNLFMACSSSLCLLVNNSRGDSATLGPVAMFEDQRNTNPGPELYLHTDIMMMFLQIKQTEFDEFGA